jgi:ribosomal protein L7/L12
MDDQERYITSLETRIYQMETVMQKLLTILTTSGAERQRTMQMQMLLQELHIDPAKMTPQGPPELGAIREALLSGDKIKAIKLYRGLYGVGLQEAQDAINAM